MWCLVSKLRCLKFGPTLKNSLLLVSVFCIGFIQVEPDQGREPDSVPDEGFEAPPPRKKHWVARIFVEDNAGVMKSIKSNIKKWEELEEYGRHWNLYSSGLYQVPGRDYKKRYLRKKLLKYVDKRLSGEIKRAEEGSTLKSIQRAHAALKPSAKAQLTESIKIRLKARLLQGEAIFFVENPYADLQTRFQLNGSTNLNIRRSISSLNITTSVDYRINEGQWQACIDRPLNKSLKARISSTQSDKDMIFSGRSEQKLELIFYKGF